MVLVAGFGAAGRLGVALRGIATTCRGFFRGMPGRTFWLVDLDGGAVGVHHG